MMVVPGIMLDEARPQVLVGVTTVVTMDIGLEIARQEIGRTNAINVGSKDT